MTWLLWFHERDFFFTQSSSRQRQEILSECQHGKYSNFFLRNRPWNAAAWNNTCNAIFFIVWISGSSPSNGYYDDVVLDFLLEARLDIRFWESPTDDVNVLGDFDGDVTNLVAGISNIKTIHFSPNFLEVFHWCCKIMPVFNNLFYVSIESGKERGWQIVPLLIKRSLNLQTLVIKGLVHEVTNRFGDEPLHP